MLLPALVQALQVFFVLGCNMEWLQQDRINSALKYWEKLDQTKSNNQVIWYLSGGVKNAIESHITDHSEAERMGSILKKKDFQVILDTSATNTAENFRNFYKFISTFDSNPQIIIVTSAFHKTRAEKFLYGFFPSTTIPEWVLAPLECSTCVRDELYHMHNVESDIIKAKT